ncbi:alpha/beta family hydrolase [Marinomonas sp. IMCC 4694]|uniref:alpha/beta family hydrolase n=1 Tax=Marinomonas sp. IMCC 4694 TaxID=2605432 RepID=UPI001652DEBE|nr:alpha/beta family hydrolase [Marinomonas sp. IMCC 4694]
MRTTPLYLAHGAGSGHQHDFLKLLSQAIELTRQQPVHPITFAYMKEQERSGKKRPPPRFDTLISEFTDGIRHEKACFVAGKSMGGRVATQLSSLPMVKGIICIGFPFYPVGKPENHRLAFLNNLTVPCLIVQGTRDRLGSLEWVSQQSLPELVDMIWLDGADHDFKTLKNHKKNQVDIIKDISNKVVAWIEAHALQIGVDTPSNLTTD